MPTRIAAICTIVLLVVLAPAGCAGDIAGDPPLLVAHRGASHDAPENTLAAFELAWERGADRIEGDFYLSKDGAIVCIHDKTTKRTGGRDRPVAEQTLEELRQLDVGRCFGARWAGERVPTLAEVLDTVPDGRAVLIEIKTDARIVPALIDAIKASPLEPRQMIVIAFDENVIAEVKDGLPGITAIWLSGFDEEAPGRWTPGLDEIIDTATRARADGVGLKANLQVIDEPFVAALRAANLEFHAWTVNDVAVARRLTDLGVDSITTDRPGWLRARFQAGVREDQE